MFERKHHQHIAELLSHFDPEVLQQAECYFGGGTAIVLLLGEYRESVDVDFLCSSVDGFRLLRNSVGSDLGDILRKPVETVRELRIDRDAMRTVVRVADSMIKVEVIKEGSLALQGAFNGELGVPTLSQVDLFASKLLANADRGLDKAAFSRDIIDIAMMIDGWGGVPDAAWQKAQQAYGPVVYRGFQRAVELIRDPRHLAQCMSKMQMDPGLLPRIPEFLVDTYKDVGRRLDRQDVGPSGPSGPD